jgi:hypothetical protein
MESKKVTGETLESIIFHISILEKKVKLTEGKSTFRLSMSVMDNFDSCKNQNCIHDYGNYLNSVIYFDEV